jgi:hypothetical protein
VAPGDEDAVRCKVVAHIKSDNTDRALAAIRAADRLPVDLSYYKVSRMLILLQPWRCAGSVRVRLLS